MSTLSSIAGIAAPLLGGAAGLYFGGPAGAMAGAEAGNLLGGILGDTPGAPTKGGGHSYTGNPGYGDYGG